MAQGKQKLSREEVIGQSREHTLFSWSVQSQVEPIALERSEGIYFWDFNGKRYMDFTSILMNVNIGHQHPRVVKAIQEQAAHFCTAHPAMATEPRASLGNLLARITPGDLTKAFFCTGGADANENAVKMARAYTGKHKVIARYRSYHGATHGAGALTGDQRRWATEPGMPGVVHILDPYCYRCPFGWTQETCSRQCITHLEDVIKFEGAENIAAVIMEGITGTNGLFIPPADYWPRVREICSRNNILLIADEVMSGFGRTGKWFAVDHWGVVPDMMTLAKGITSGYVPLGCVMVSQKIADYFENRMLRAGLTHNTHPLACAAASECISVYEEEGMIDNSARLGAYLDSRLKELKQKFPLVGDTRCLGLFAVVEMVKDRASKEPLPDEVMNRLGSYLRDQGFFTYIKHQLIFVVPPLCITKEQLDEGLEILEAGIATIS